MKESTPPMPLHLKVALAVEKKYIAPGKAELLPSLLDIADEFGVSKVSAEKAVRLLVHKGSVHSVRGKGTFILKKPAGPSDLALTRIVLLPGNFFSDTSFWFGNAILHGVQRACRLQGLDLDILPGTVKHQLVEISERGWLKEPGIGFFVARSGVEALGAIHESLSSFRRPMVALENYTLPGIRSARIQTREGVRLALGHLAACGRRKWITMEVETRAGGFQERHAAFAAEADLRRGEVTVMEPIRIPAGRHASEIRAGYEATLAHLKTHGFSFDGLFAPNDGFATGALLALKERGIRVPEEVAICGFDDERRLCEGMVPALTSVRYDAALLGERAILALLSDRDPEPVAVELVVRESTRGS